MFVERRGRGSSGRPRKLPVDVEEDLLAEVQRLRAEVDYLKNCKPWFRKTSDASPENAGSSEAKAKMQSETSPLKRSTTTCNFLLSPQANEWLRYFQEFDSIEHFKSELIEYLNYYNNRGIKAKLKGLPPAIHRQQALGVA